jgi:hypothetical protein
MGTDNNKAAAQRQDKMTAEYAGHFGGRTGSLNNSLHRLGPLKMFFSSGFPGRTFA